MSKEPVLAVHGSLNRVSPLIQFDFDNECNDNLVSTCDSQSSRGRIDAISELEKMISSPGAALFLVLATSSVLAASAAPPDVFAADCQTDPNSSICFSPNDRIVLPTPGTVVSVGLAVEDVAVNDDDVLITAALKMNLGWTEPRLEVKAAEKDAVATLDGKVARDNLWLPDLVAMSQKEFRFAGGASGWTPGSPTVEGATLFSNKTVSYWMSARLTVGCDFDFAGVPFDTQVCRVRLGSFGHAKEDLEFRLDDLVSVEGKQRMTEYEVAITTLPKKYTVRIHMSEY